MDPAKIIPQEKVDAIDEAIRMAPTSSGTQPFELVVVTNTDICSKIAKAAVEQEVDTTPMESFNPNAVDEILGLQERGLRSVVLMPLGYRDATGDWPLPMGKVRKARDKLVTELN